MALRVVIVGGGTGGHLFPGIAVAREFLVRLQAQVTFLTTPKAVTTQILEQYHIPWQPVASRALKGEGRLSRLRTWWGLPGTVVKAREPLQSLNPHLVLGMGGYASGPVGVAAWSLGIPLAIHEQNAIPGFANRWLARLARRVFLSFPDPQGFLPRDKSLVTGNPIRGEFFEPAAARPDDPFTVLVMGGSQGAHHLNMQTLAALPHLADLKGRLRFLHLAGAADEAMVAEGYRESGFATEAAAFIREVAAWMGRAHLVVCRAGASSLAELAATGRAALLVPYPFAANNHQEYNARFFEEAGAAEVILNQDLTGDLLAAKIREYIEDPEILRRREAASQSLARPNAARDIVEGCRELIV